MARAIRQIAAPVLTRADRGRLRVLLDAVPDGADESDPRFLALLDGWESIHAPWNLRPTVRAYRCYGGSWLTAGVGPVLAAIRQHLETAA